MASKADELVRLQTTVQEEKKVNQELQVARSALQTQLDTLRKQLSQVEQQASAEVRPLCFSPFFFPYDSFLNFLWMHA